MPLRNEWHFVMQRINMKEEAHNRHSFILRIWREGENQEWKSSVQHANSCESIPLASIDELQAFITQFTHQDDPPTSGKTMKTKKRSGLK